MQNEKTKNMGKKILIDLNICRECGTCQTDCAYDFHPGNKGIRSLLELAVFAYTCRKCESAPCITVCPEEALYKDDNNIVQRAVNLCVACHSCVAACPFGTMMNEFFESRKSICDYCDLANGTEELLCVKTCPEDALKLVDIEPDKEQNIYQLNEHVLIRDYPWEVLVET